MVVTLQLKLVNGHQIMMEVHIQANRHVIKDSQTWLHLVDKRNFNWKSLYKIVLRKPK